MGLERVGEEPGPHLGHKKHNQSNIGGKHDGKGSKGKGCILLTGQNHGDRGSDEAQDLGRQSVFGETQICRLR
jgi:hypothetical protein